MLTVATRLLRTPTPDNPGARTVQPFDWQVAVAATDGSLAASLPRPLLPRLETQNTGR